MNESESEDEKVIEHVEISQPYDIQHQGTNNEDLKSILLPRCRGQIFSTILVWPISQV